MPVPRVSCRCSAISSSGHLERMAPISRSTERGVAQPMASVSLMPLSLKPASSASSSACCTRVQDQLGRELAFEVAAEGAQDDAPFDRHAAVLEGLERHALLDHGVRHRLADVLAREGIGGGDAHAAIDVQRAAQGALEALLVEPQGAVFDAGLAPDPRRHFLGVGHGRHALGIDVGDAGDVLRARCPPAPR